MQDLQDFLKVVRTLTADNYVSYFQDTLNEGITMCL